MVFTSGINNDKAKLKVMGDNANKLAVNEFYRKLLADKWVNWVTAVIKW